MARGFQGATMRMFGARDHLATVTGTEWLAPHFLRVRLTSATVFDEIPIEPTSWLRFWFPDPDGGETEYQRAYTLTEANAETGEFAVDFVMHEPAGPACLWAAAARPGEEIAVMSSLSANFEVPEELPAGFLLVGDAASMPAINSVLEVLPPQVPVELYLERHSEHDERIPLRDHQQLRVHWTDRAGAESLAAAIETRDWSNWYAWAAPESGSLKALQSRLREEFGFPKREIHARAYWIQGRSMGKDRAPTEGSTPTAPDAVEPTPPPRSAPAVDAPAAAPGRWRSQAAGRLLASLRSQLIVAGVLQALATLLQLAPFVLLVELARQLLSGEDGRSLAVLVAWALALLGAGTLLGSALLLWLHVVDARFARALRLKLLDKLSKLPLGWFGERGSTGVKSLVADDTLSLHYLVTHAIGDAVAAVIAPLAVLGYLFAVDWRLALVLLVPILAYLVTMYVMVIQSGPKIGAAQRWAERMGAAAAGYLDGQPVVRTFGGAAASSFTSRLDAYLAFLNDWQRPFIGKKTANDLITRPSTFGWLIIAVGTFRVIGGGLDVVDLMAFLLLGTTFGAKLLGIGYGLSGIRGGMLAARRIGAALDERELEPLASDADRAGARPGTVELEHVTFSYHPGVPVIRDVTATLEPGTVTALVGPSGSGKSTLAALVARFHDVDAGVIRIGGDDIRGLDGDELYRRVGFVLQDVALVTGTVAENIALARPEATRPQIEAAAREAQIHERITKLPQGYDTLLGDAVVLSGGERQRLTIARAILADTPVLVLDEATAFADPESEYLVQRALDRLTRERTVLVIAHRLHTITGADQILVLDGGAVLERGGHVELLDRGGRYRRLWDASERQVSR